MPAITFVRYTVVTEGREPVQYRSEEGITLREVLTEELGVNPSKHDVLVNGITAGDLDVVVNNGDSIVLATEKYSSGNAAA